ncbi:hypothetical protein FOZ60_002232 [Perkinsus olseni]|uniref:Uncharacterized protein n=1 Tax=Perkinsus olseni TaxID=32597 RepID=A0A7J6NYJ7_PEROL|nr:hypothetical protein FOZ60_002232 [Perkinsus olseni]
MVKSQAVETGMSVANSGDVNRNCDDSATAAGQDFGTYPEGRSRSKTHLVVEHDHHKRPLSAPANVIVTRHEIIDDRILAQVLLRVCFGKARDGARLSRPSTARSRPSQGPRRQRTLTAPTTSHSSRTQVNPASSGIAGVALLSRSLPTFFRAADRLKHARRQRAREDSNVARKEARTARREKIMADFDICIKSLKEASRKYRFEKGLKDDQELYEERIFHSGEQRNLPRAESQGILVGRPSSSQWRSDVTRLKEDLLNSQWKIMKRNPEVNRSGDRYERFGVAFVEEI